MIDGVSGMRLLQRVLSEDPNERNMPPPWDVHPQQKLREDEPGPNAREVSRHFSEALQLQASSASALFNALSRVYASARDEDDALMGPFSGPVSVLNGRVTGQRRFATQHYELDRIR